MPSSTTSPLYEPVPGIRKAGLWCYGIRCCIRGRSQYDPILAINPERVV